MASLSVEADNASVALLSVQTDWDWAYVCPISSWIKYSCIQWQPSMV